MRLLAALVLLAGLGRAAAGELGLPIVRSFAPREYAALSQNWAFVEDRRGVIYAGNNAGALEYDGGTWRILPTRHKSVVRALGLDASGRVYVGAKNEFGYLAPDASGRMAFVPLDDLVPEAARNFGDVWSVLPTAEGICFSTREWVFRYDGAAIQARKADTSFTVGWVVRGQAYLFERGVGPVRMEPGRFAPLPGGERFKAEAINFMLPWGEGGAILLGTAHQGLFLFDGAGFEPFPSEADPYLRKAIVSSGALLDDGSLAVATISGGCFILDRQGRILIHLDRKSGLRDDQVNRVLADRHARLWLALNRGLARAEWPSAFTAFGEDAGLEGTLTTLYRHGGDLYAGTSRGLFLLEPRSAGKGEPELTFGPFWRFRKVAGIDTYVWRLMPFQGRLLAANSRGVYEVVKDRATLAVSTLNDRDTLCMAPSPTDPGRLWLGLQTGLAALRRSGSRWRLEPHVPGVKGEVRTVVELADGTLWAGTQASGVFRVAPGGAVETFGLAQGLPSMAHDYVVGLSIGPVFTTHDGIYRFDEGARRFERDPRFKDLLGPGQWYLDGLTEGPGGKLWMHAVESASGAHETGCAAPGPGGAWRFESRPWKRISESTLYAFLPEPDGPVWMGGPDGLLRYDPALDRAPERLAPPLIRRVAGPGGRVLHGGAGAWTGAGRLPYASNTLRFEFAAPGAGPDGSTRFQVRLQGYDKDWSPWSSETFRDYTNLPEGRYRFQVRALDALGQESEAAEAAFRILPPFYRTWWAYLLYLTALGGVGHLLVQWRLWRSQQARRVLVHRVAERTEQLRRRTAQLELAKAAAEAATRAKSEFLANMSHEIRTPLNTILGYSEILRDEVEDPRHKDHLTAISSGGKALLGIIGDILDLSKIEAGRMELDYAPALLADLVEEVVRTFALRAGEKGLALSVVIDPVLPRALVLSQVHLRQILFNLVGNAVKFTERGAIRVRVLERGRGQEQVDLAIRVEDTGIGIPEAQLAGIFDAFQQVSGQDRNRYGGTGLGLAICRRLADVMGGDLQVESVQGQGSAFTLTLRGVAIAPVDAVAGAPEPPFRGEFLPATLLLADDIQPNRDLLKHFFESSPFRFLEASDGAQALDLARRSRPDLIIMDLRMPVLDGIGATLQLKADPETRAIPVIVLTASTTQADEGPVWASGADGFLRKPVSRARLAAEIARFLPFRAPAPAPEIPDPGAEAALPGLLAILEAEPLAEWEKLKDAFFIDRMAAFSARMGGLAEQYREPSLKAWAAQVQAQAGAFDMANLPTTFRRFPEILEGLRRSALR